ncbi:disease resistance protein L6-like [Rhodamnia argentea]|uniref:Disease resistance protein L6-like n=1 Tax=Rhodamnia argentea TaxID=178133 RepID=A0A8B8QEB0_9MYRT|nr:disease resistance protein L6-like [Rhodamnia argentea]XP_048136379.1 disease resistance protein L6-like [Rhodamnia argentea]
MTATPSSSIVICKTKPSSMLIGPVNPSDIRWCLLMRISITKKRVFLFDGDDADLVDHVTRAVLSRLGLDSQLPVTKHFVEAGDRVKEIRKWADTPATHARMIGIYGMGGIGKTTFAKVIYNELLNEFGHRCFLSDIRETARCNGILYVQNQLIKAMQKIENQVCNVDDGINLIKSRLKRKKVLILLDDIDHKDQLNALARERDWFTSGSIIIVTTRNEALLDEPEFWVDHKCGLGELNKVQSLLLFNRHAFRTDHSSMGFESISRDIVARMGGLPLALEVVGSYLYGKTDQEVWRVMLRKLKIEPHIDVQKVLKLSYDVLERKQREIFLDIACSFIGKKSKFAMYIWKDSGFNASEEIEELKLRCLIKTGHNGELRMHDQLRDLGRTIVDQERLPETRTRLWDYEEASRVLLEKKGTNMIRAICLDKYYDHHPWRPAGHLRTYTSEQFRGLQDLRFLQLRRAALSGDFKELFSELRWLQWSDIDPNLSFSATNLHLPKLLVLELSYNQITEHWSGWSSIKASECLTVLDLSFCNYLRRTPDLSAFTKLEILILKHCDGLEEVDPSIGKVKRLVSLDLSNCGSLKELPQEVGKLRHLKELILDSTSITEIPTSIGSLMHLEKLSAKGCRSLREIPNTIGYLWELRHLDFSESAIEKLPSTIGMLKMLRTLCLESCRNLQGEIPIEICCLSSLEILQITRAPISNLPESIRCLCSLQHLSLKGCDELQSLPEQLPSGLTHLTVSCQSRWVSSLSYLIGLEELGLYGCDLLEDIPELPPTPLKLCVASCHKLIMPKLVGFKYLADLSIMYCNSIEILHLSQLNSLKRLHVEYCYDLVEIRGLDNLELLEEIVIDCCKSIQRLILPELPSLKRLKANYCHNLVEIQGLDRAMFLEALDISDCGSIKGLPDLSLFTTLKELSINDCRNMHGVESLESFLSCRSIYITGCTSLEKLPNLSKFENLESFTMRYSLRVTEILGVEESRSLTHIDITGCESIETLPDLSGCEKLQSLVVRDCKKLTQLLGLEKLGLIYLDISGCDSLERIPKLPGASVFRHYQGRAYGLFHDKISLHEKIILR